MRARDCVKPFWPRLDGLNWTRLIIVERGQSSIPYGYDPIERSFCGTPNRAQRCLGLDSVALLLWCGTIDCARGLKDTYALFL